MDSHTAPGPVTGALERRHSELRGLMHESRIDVLVATSASNIFYLSGFASQSAFQGSAAVILGRETDALLVYAEMDSAAATEVPDLMRTQHWTDSEGVAAVVASALVDTIASASGRRVGIESNHLTVAYLDEFQAQSADTQFVACEQLLVEQRLHKSESELALARSAGEQLSAICESALALRYKGRSELDLKAYIEYELRRAGAEVSSVLVLGGDNSSRPRSRSGARVFEAGDIVLLDLAARFDHYWSDITRCGYIGEPAPMAPELWSAVSMAHRAGVDAGRGGEQLKAVDRSARSILTDAGLGHLFPHRTGHGLGLDVIEPPAVDDGAPLVISPNMLYTVEPGVYVDGEFGLRLEDTVAVLADGPEMLTTTPRQLHKLS